MSTAVLTPGTRPAGFGTGATKAKDPFQYGWRTNGHNEVTAANFERIPLTEWDILHPEEGVTLVQTANHAKTTTSLFGSLSAYFADRADILVTFDQRIDWQVDGLVPHVPDVAIFENMTRRPSDFAGTFPVKDFGATPLLVIEVTSPSTWRVDLNQKVDDYFRAGVPFYLIIDNLRDDDGDYTLHPFCYRLTTEGYVLVKYDPEKGVWIPNVKLWFRIEGQSCRCYDAGGNSIDRRAEEQLKYEAEKARADALALELAELKAKISPP